MHSVLILLRYWGLLTAFPISSEIPPYWIRQYCSSLSHKTYHACLPSVGAVEREREREREGNNITLTKYASLSVISSFRAFKTSFIDEIKRTFICESAKYEICYLNKFCELKVLLKIKVLRSSNFCVESLKIKYLQSSTFSSFWFL